MDRSTTQSLQPALIPSKRKIYTRPQLLTYGNLRELTEASPLTAPPISNDTGGSGVNVYTS